MMPYNLIEFTLRAFIPAVFIIFGFFHGRDITAEHNTAVYVGAVYGKMFSIASFLSLFCEFMVTGFKNYCLGGIRRNELKFTREKMGEGIHMSVALGSFFTVALMTAGSSLLIGCFHDKNLAGNDMFVWGSLIVLFMPLSMFFKTFVNYTGKKRASLIIGAAAFAMSAVFAVIMCETGTYGCKSMIISFVIYFIVFTAGSGFFCIRGFKCRIPVVSYIAIPVGTAALSGVLMMLLNRGLINIVGGLFSFLICFLLDIYSKRVSCSSFKKCFIMGNKHYRF